MRNYGRIKKWVDEKGFGFITPHSGGDEVFVHAKVFTNAQRRPLGNEQVSYDLGTDVRRRVCAVNVVFVGEKLAKSAPPASVSDGGSWTLVGFALLFLALLGYGVYSGAIPHSVLILYCAASVVAFFSYGLDKAAASSNKWRTAESTLLMFGLIGGWPGALIAQELFRHKYKKQSFRFEFWVTVIFNFGALILFLWPPATQVFMSFVQAITHQ